MEEQEYTPKILAVKCPVCHALGRCLVKKRDGSDYRPYPHPERVALAEGEQKNG